MLSFISKVRLLAFLRPEYLSTVYLALAVRVFIHNSCRLLFNTRSRYKSYLKVIKGWIWALKAENVKGGGGGLIWKKYFYYSAPFRMRFDYILSLRQPTFSRWTAHHIYYYAAWLRITHFLSYINFDFT